MRGTGSGCRAWRRSRRVIVIGGAKDFSPLPRRAPAFPSGSDSASGACLGLSYMPPSSERKRYPTPSRPGLRRGEKSFALPPPHPTPPHPVPTFPRGGRPFAPCPHRLRRGEKSFALPPPRPTPPHPPHTFPRRDTHSPPFPTVCVGAKNLSPSPRRTRPRPIRCPRSPAGDARSPSFPTVCVGAKNLSPSPATPDIAPFGVGVPPSPITVQAENPSPPPGHTRHLRRFFVHAMPAEDFPGPRPNAPDCSQRIVGCVASRPRCG